MKYETPYLKPYVSRTDTPDMEKETKNKQPGVNIQIQIPNFKNISETDDAKNAP